MPAHAPPSRMRSFLLTLFTVVSVLVQPVAAPAPAQVAPKRVDALVLAATIVLGALILVWGGQGTLLRGAANLGTFLVVQNLLKVASSREPP